MEIIRAKTAGFCFGVKRAVDLVYEAVEKEENIYTYGPIIHNEEVIKELEEKGVRIIKSPEELKALKEGTVIIRSHGVEEEIYRIIEEKGLKCIDATCPFVKKIHNIVRQESEKGKDIVIIGDKDHPEVKGIISYASSNVSVINSPADADKYLNSDKKEVCIVAQTTYDINKFKDVIEKFEKKEYSVNVVNTICSATSERQREAMKIAAKADCMIVIGGSHSSNSRKLFELCCRFCDNTVFVQTLEDLVSQKCFLSKSTACVGITAGASTPNNIIEEVQKYVRRYDI